MKNCLKLLILNYICFILFTASAEEFCLSPASDLKNIKYNLSNSDDLIKELAPYFNESLYDYNQGIMENRELSLIITHVNSKHDPYKQALPNAELIINNTSYNHIYEHTVPWAKSHIKHELQEIVFRKDQPYFIEDLKGNSFVIIGGGKSYCHYHAFENLIKQLQEKGEKRFEIHFPYPAIYLSYYEPGDEEIGNVLLNSPMENGRVVSLFKRAMKRITDFQDYYDFMIKNNINFTIHNDNGENYSFLINDSLKALSIDIYLWNTIETMFDFMDKDQADIKFKRRNTPDLLRFFSKNIRYWLENNKSLFTINTLSLLKKLYPVEKKLFKEKLISDLLEEVIEEMNSIQIYEFIDSIKEDHHGNYYLKLGDSNFVLNELAIDDLQPYALSFFIFNMSKKIKGCFSFSEEELHDLMNSLIIEIYDIFQNGRSIEYYTRPIEANMIFKGYFSLNFLKEKFSQFLSSWKSEREIVDLFACQLKNLNKNIVYQDISKENRIFAEAA